MGFLVTSSTRSLKSWKSQPRTLPSLIPLILLSSGHRALSLAMCAISLLVAAAGPSAALPALSLAHALPLARTSSTPLRTPLSAPMLALDARVETLPGTGSRAAVWSQVVTTLTLAAVTRAILTAWHLAHTMCQRLQSTQRAHPLSTHLHLARALAPRVATASLTHPTR